MEAQPRVVQPVSNRPQDLYKTPFQPQILQIPNSDQKIQPPLMIDDQEPKQTGPLITNDINDFDDPSSQNDIIQVFHDQPSV